MLAARLRERFRGAFTGVNVRLVAHRSDASPTKARIVSALRELAQAGPEDTVIVFIASHGAAAESDWQEYYFLPADTSISALERLGAEQEGKAPPPGASLDTLL